MNYINKLKMNYLTYIFKLQNVLQVILIKIQKKMDLIMF